MSYKFIITESRSRVGVVTLNRPEALNAINLDLLEELMASLADFDSEQAIGAMVVTGSPKAFAAGADIKEMAGKTAAEINTNGFISAFSRLMHIRKPVIAAVSGWALGGGCEIALACDLIVASETAKFGQPEIGIGVIPGAGGTQRLTRAVGKYLAMEIILNNRVLSAREALEYGLVNRVVPVDRYLEEAISLAQEIASRAPLAVAAAKSMINQVYEGSLSDGMELERQAFFELLASDDRREGMQAFLEKRTPRWTGT